MSAVRHLLQSLQCVLRSSGYRVLPLIGSKRYNSYEESQESTFGWRTNSLKSVVLASLGAIVYSIYNGDVIAAAVTEEQSLVKENDPPKKSNRRRTGFRDRRIISYEDRLRAYSTPDKLFRYFATVRMVDSIYMTPDDFVRSITPGVKQPDGLGLDSFHKFHSDTRGSVLPPESVFNRFGKWGLISFPDYVFLLTLLASPPRQFEIAFRMFDRNGDGLLDHKEFELVRAIIMSSTHVGKRHRDREVTGNTLRQGVSSGHDAAGSSGSGSNFNLVLSSFFFGPNGDGKLSVEDFLKFQAEVQQEVCRLEFVRYEPENGRIHELDFADALLIYADFSPNKRKRMLRRVRRVYPREEEEEEDEEDGKKAKVVGNVKKRSEPGGISFAEYCAFVDFVRCIADIDTALSFYNFAGVPVDRTTFCHVARTVAHVELAPRVLDVMFLLFDENEDDRLSQREFTAVMRRRQMRCLDRPMDTGFVRFVSSLVECLWEQRHFRPLDKGHSD